METITIDGTAVAKNEIESMSLRKKSKATLHVARFLTNMVGLFLVLLGGVGLVISIGLACIHVVLLVISGEGLGESWFSTMTGNIIPGVAAVAGGVAAGICGNYFESQIESGRVQLSLLLKSGRKMTFRGGEELRQIHDEFQG